MKYSKRIYPKEALLKAIKAYGGLCNITISEDDRYWILELNNYTVNKKKLIDEFGNYLLEIINGADVIE